MRNHPRDSGFTIVEVMIAMFLLSVGLIAVAPMFLQAIKSNRVSADMNLLSSIGIERMELIRATPFTGLPDGGSLDSNQTVGGNDYFDLSDPDHAVRWVVTTQRPGLKRVVVRVKSATRIAGRRKVIEMSSMRSF